MMSIVIACLWGIRPAYNVYATLFVTTLSFFLRQSHMHTDSVDDGCTAYCYPEQCMFDRLLRVHIQSQQAFGPWWTLS